MDTEAYICYIPATVRIQVRSLESIFIKRSSYESRTKLVLPFKKIREYSGKKKKKDLHVVHHRLIKPVQVLYIRLSIIVK